MKFTLVKTAVVAAAMATPLTAAAQLQITEIMYNPVGNDAVYEWFEVKNIGTTTIDLSQARIAALDDTVGPNFGALVASADTTTTIAPGQVAVLYDAYFSAGSVNNYNDSVFRTAWNVPSTVPVIAIDFMSLSNSGPKTIGVWSDYSQMTLDSIATPTEAFPDDRQITGFANALGSATYDNHAPWPGDTNGVSIQWNGVGDPNNGASWYQSQVGVNGATTSNPIIDNTNVTFKNSTSDLGSPGIVPAGPVASGLVISEIMYNPASNEMTTPAWEWVEVYNNTGAAIDFASTPYVLDDDNSTFQTAANVKSGAIPNGSVAVFFDATNNNLADMQTAWGAGINFIPVTGWNALNNSGIEGLGIWSSFASYASETNNSSASGHPGTLTNALSSVNYQDNAGGWPDAGGSQSIYLANLSSDQKVGANWALSGNLNDFDSFLATGVPLSGDNTVYPGGGVGSPGVFEATGTPGLAGDYNGDNVVDAADYTVWRDGGSPDSTIAGYNLWVANYGKTAASSSVAVPEPAAVLTVFGALACVAGLRRR